MFARTISIFCLIFALVASNEIPSGSLRKVSLEDKDHDSDHHDKSTTPPVKKPDFTLYNHKGAPYSTKTILSQTDNYCEILLSGDVYSDEALTHSVGKLSYRTWFTTDYYVVVHNLYLANGTIAFDNWIAAPHFTHDFTTCSANLATGLGFQEYVTGAIGDYAGFYAPNPGYIKSSVLSTYLRKYDFYHA